MTNEAVREGGCLCGALRYRNHGRRVLAHCLSLYRLPAQQRRCVWHVADHAQGQLRGAQSAQRWVPVPEGVLCYDQQPVDFTPVLQAWAAQQKR